MKHTLRHETQEQEISAGGLLAGLFLFVLVALGVAVSLSLLALTSP